MIASQPKERLSLQTMWHRGELMTVSRNTMLRVLIRKAERQERIWNFIDSMASKLKAGSGHILRIFRPEN